MRNRPLLLIAILVLFSLLPAACAPAAAPTSMEKPTEELKPSEAPATLPSLEPPTNTPPHTPIPTPTFAGQVPTQTPIIEERIVHVEWPASMRLGESDIIRLALVLADQGYTLTTDFPEHPTITQTVGIPRPGGYDLFAVARLDGVGFSIAPSEEQVQFLPPAEGLSWRWSLTPNHPGQQRLSLTLKLRWVPNSKEGGQVREIHAYSTSLNVNVVSLLGLSHSQAILGGLLGLVCGGSISAYALVSRPRRKSRAAPAPTTPLPNPILQIELPAGIRLSGQERTLLQTLFRRYQRLVIEQEFLSGYSGARTFLALPIRPDGRSDAYTIAKIGATESIRREFDNYEVYVKDTLPPITARIQHPPVLLPSSLPPVSQTVDNTAQSPIAALQYTFIGEPGSTPVSLRQALKKDPDPRWLDMLFKTFGPNWWMQRKPYTFRLALEYDRLLPTHLVLEPAQGKGYSLDGCTPPGEVNLDIGQLVTLYNIASSEVRADGRSLSLLGQTTPGQPPLRVRWLSLQNPEGATGLLVATRQSLLGEIVKDLNLIRLQDPLPRLPEFLAETIVGSQSTIHGDLNLENILLGPGGMVWLIDFAQTRDGHALFDFVHLEAEIIAHILAPLFTAPADYLTLLEHPDSAPGFMHAALRDTLHEISSHCLANPSHLREYQLALCLTCLGALKYPNLTIHARRLLYLTAAELAQRL